MSMDEFILILDKLSKQTKNVYYHLMGEPLTHPLLPEFIRQAGVRGFKSVIITNVSLENGWKIPVVFAFGIRHFLSGASGLNGQTAM